MNLRPHWRGHLLLFERREPVARPPSVGLRILLVVALLEGVLGPRLHILDVAGLRQLPAAARLALLLAAALLLAKYFVALPMRGLGLRRWREWQPTEKSYFVQVVLIANAVFAALFWGRPRPETTAAMVAVQFAWGFYQELVHRSPVSPLAQLVDGRHPARHRDRMDPRLRVAAR